ncbi:MAG: hypothetical protein KVP17_000133 [Porospora cf. gigantea B]|uniref:uncharacterized protein n=1 Tax=Porospora cf. gigantea B TaxID=2853592 RepID=UPI003571A121|nr:MAG: hypothetical protein KVP17_000133 [Porospora cf. gigantea B]
MTVTLYLTKKLCTLEEGLAGADTVAVKGDRIVAVGKLADLQRLFRDAHVDRSFSEKFVYPGFIDPNLHLWLFQLCLICEVVSPDVWSFPWSHNPSCLTSEDFETRVKGIVAAHEAGRDVDDYIMVWGYHRDWHGCLTKEKLNAWSPNKPLCIWQRSMHEAVLNDAMMKRLNLTREAYAGTPAHDDTKSWNSQHFVDEVLFAMLPRLLTLFTNSKKHASAFKKIKELLLDGGVTMCCDQGIQLFGDALTAFNEGVVDAKLACDLFMVPECNIMWKIKGRDAFDVIDSMVKNQNNAAQGYKMLPKQVKLYSDGSAFPQKMMLKQKYTDGGQGEWLMTPENFKRCTELFWENDYQIHAHCHGDLGCEVVIHTLKGCMEDRPRSDHRFCVHHLCVIKDTQPQKLRNFGAVASTNPNYVHVLGDKYSDVGVGSERAHLITRNRTYEELGMKCSYHSGAPVAPTKPLHLMWAAVTRTGMESGRSLGPSECVRTVDALKAVTINAAYTIQCEKDYGSINSGKFANLTVLDEDLFDVNPMRIKDLHVHAILHKGIMHLTPKSR